MATTKRLSDLQKDESSDYAKFRKRRAEEKENTDKSNISSAEKTDNRYIEQVRGNEKLNQMKDDTENDYAKFIKRRNSALLADDLQQKKSAQQGFLDSEENVGFWDAMFPGGATPSQYKESRQKKKQYEKEVEEAASEVAAYEQFWAQKKAQEKSSAEIDAYLAKTDKEIEKLEEEKGSFLEAMKPGGVKPSEYNANRKAKEAEIKKLESQQGMYRAVRDEKKSREMTDNLPEDVKGLLDVYNGYSSSNDYIDYTSLFATADTRSHAQVNSQKMSNAAKQQAVADKLVAMGYDNYKELAEYRKYITDIEKTQRVQKESEDFARENGVVASAVSLLTSPASTVQAVKGIAPQGVADLNPNPYNEHNLGNVFGETVQNTVAESFEDGMISAGTKRMLYNTAMSGADSAMVGLFGSPALTGGYFFLKSFNSSYYETLKKGGTTEQALATGVAAGAAEGICEAISLGAFVKGVEPATVKGIVKNVLVQAGVNAQEEATTELVNMLSDYYINGGLSDFYQNYEYALSTGMSEEEAKQYATDISVKQVAESAISGALMGSAFGVMGSTAGNVSYNSALKDAGKQAVNEGKVDNVLAGASDIEGNEIVRNLIGEVEAGQSSGKLKGKDYKNIGKLIEQLDKVTGEDRSKLIETAVKNRLTELGEVDGIDVKTSAISKVIENGGRAKEDAVKLTKAEKKAIKKGTYTQRVLNEIGDAAGMHSSAWADTLGEDVDSLYKRRYEPDVEAYKAGQSSQEDPSTASGSSSPSGTENEGATEQKKTASGKSESEVFRMLDDDHMKAAENAKAQIKQALVQPGQDENIFNAGFELYYEQGRSGGFEFTEVKENPNVSESFTEYQRQQAFEQGQHQRLKDVGNARYKGGTVAVFVNGYSGKSTVNSYAQAFDRFYAEGAHTKKSFEDVLKSEGHLFKVIDEGVARKAFEEGRKQPSPSELRSATSPEGRGKKSTKKAGSYRSKTIEEGDIDTFFEAFAGKLGMDVERVQRIADGEHEANAQVDLKSGKMVSSASSRNEYQSSIHESVHIGYAYGDKEKMAEVEETMKDYFVNLHGASVFENVLRQYEQAYPDLDRAGVMEEFTADALAGVFSSEQGINEFVDWLQTESGYTQAQKKTILEKLSEWLLEIIDKIRELVETEHLNDVSKEFANAQAEQFADVRQKFLQVLDEIEGVEGAEGVKNSLTRSEIDLIQSFGVRKSVNSFSSSEIEKTKFLAEMYYKQLGVKSPFFRAWFGDWRAYDTTPIAIADVKGKARGKTINLDTKWEINISRILFNESKSHNSIRNKTALPYLDYINDIVQKAVLLDTSTIKNKKSENSLFMHSFYSIADIGNGPELLKLYVEEMNDVNTEETSKRAYQLQNIEKQQVVVTGSQNNSVSRSNQPTVISTISDLFALVKQKDKDFQPNPVNKALLNDNGTPKVMYHGTPSDMFYEFSYDKVGMVGGGEHGYGFYFTDIEREAQMYAQGKGNIIKSYINITNPINATENDLSNNVGLIFHKLPIYAKNRLKEEYGDLDTAKKHYSKYDNGTMLSVLLREAEMHPSVFNNLLSNLGYDGIVYSEEGYANEYVVFRSNNIKSVNNRGTFDAYNPDIRYSKKVDFDKSEELSKLETEKKNSIETDSKGRILTREQSEFFKDSKIRVSEVDGWKNTITPDGELFPVYHGTNSDEFFEFDKKAIGSANDTGWYGKGFYFAFDEREARFYGRRTMECYLNVKKPFFFSEEMQSFKGQSSGDVNFDFASFIINLSEKFPEIAKKTFVEVAEFNSDEVTDRSFAEFAEEIKEIYDSNRFKLSEVDDGGTTTYQYVYSRDIDNIEASENIKRLIREKFIDSSWSAEYYKDKGVITESEFDEILDLFEKYGESRFRDVWIPGRFTDAEYAKKNRLSSVITYLANKKYSYINQHMPEYYMENYIGDDLSQELRKRGYDGILQSKFGDEIVVFDSNQIKLVDNKKPTESPDIRHSRKFSLDWIDFAEEQQRERSAASELTELKKINEELRAQIRHPGVKHIVSQLGVQKVARHLKGEYMSKVNIHKLAGELGDFYTLIANGDGISWDSLQIHIERIADMILGESKYKKPDISDYAKDVLRDIRSVKIKLNDAQKSEVASEYGSYNEFRKKTMGTLVLSNEGISLDERWGELSKAYPHFFPEDTADTDQPRVLMEAVASLRETYEDMNGMDLESARDMLMTEIYEQYFEVPETKYISEEYKLKYAKAKADFGEKLREAKADFKKQKDEAYRKAKAEYGEILKGIREEEAEAILQAKARYNLRAEKMADTRVREKKRANVIKQVKRLDKLLRTPGKGAPSAGTNKYGQDYVHLTNIPESLKRTVIDFCSVFIEHDAGVFSGVTKRDNVSQREKRIEAMQRQYAALKKSESYLKESVNEDMAEKLDVLSEIMAERRLSQLTAAELDTVIEITDHLITVINNQVEMWVDGKKHKVEGLGSSAVDQLTAKGQYKHLPLPGHDFVKGWGVNNMKPVYFFERVGGVLEKLFLEMQNKGQRDYARNINAAAAFMDETSKKFAYEKWTDEDPLVLKTTQGDTLKLTKSQAMHIWATAKREAIAGKDSRHIMQGGIVFPDEIDADVVSDSLKDKVGNVADKKKLTDKVWKYKKSDGSAHRISLDDLDKISEYLTDEQKKFVDTMVGYLSNDMAALGNEVSMELYGIKRFNEKYYIPFNSAKNFIYRSMGEQGEAMLRSESFTKETSFGANNPLVVGDFLDVVAGHIERMAMYNSMVLPLENFSKIWNFKTFVPEGDDRTSQVSVRSAMETAFGKSYVSYVDTLLKDINGGINADSREKSIGRLLSNFKKTAVLGSASVVIQQPSAIVRAFAEIDPSYFVASTFVGRKRAWEKALKYSSTALLKDIGGFDTVSGRGTVDWLTKTEYKGKDKVIAFFKDSQYRDDIIAWGPGFADKVTWAHIWAACEREVASKNKGLKGEELYKKTGERFDEVINKTQVYDSVLTRSAHMRSKSQAMQVVTSFMSEPTTQANMIASAMFNAKKGDKKKAARIYSSVILSQLFNAALVSAIYAARDDDEDKTLVEKYLAELTSNFVGSLNPLTMIPLFKDVWSLLEGYDVERSDMAVYADVVDSWKAWKSDSKTDAEKIIGTIGSVGNVFGLPIKNILRDAAATVNVAKSVGGISDTTGKGIFYALEESLFPVTENLTKWKPTTKEEKLYAAFSEGDKKMYNRIASQYTSGGKIKSDLKKQIGERFVEGDIDERTAISQFRKLGLSENEAYYEVRSLKEPLPEEESEDTNADFFDFDSMQNIQGDADAELEADRQKAEDEGEEYSEKGDYDWLDEALSSGDRAKITNEVNDLKSRGVSDSKINSHVKSWIKENDSSVSSEAQRYKSGNLGSFESTVRSVASKYGTDESTVAGAIRSAAGVNSKAIEGTMYTLGDIHTAMSAGDSSQTTRIASSVIDAKTNGYISEGYTRAEATKKARQSVRSSLTSEWKSIYLSSSSTERTRIRQQLYATGAYDDLGHLDEILQGWREDN